MSNEKPKDLTDVSAQLYGYAKNLRESADAMRKALDRQKQAILRMKEANRKIREIIEKYRARSNQPVLVKDPLLGEMTKHVARRVSSDKMTHLDYMEMSGLAEYKRLRALPPLDQVRVRDADWEELAVSIS